MPAAAPQADRTMTTPGERLDLARTSLYVASSAKHSRSRHWTVIERWGADLNSKPFYVEREQCGEAPGV